MDKSQMLSRLVENAIDFLNKSRAELENDPKYSLINFHASCELFLKARLMAEHWTLVVASRTEPKLDSFMSGNFQSVTLKDANNRLKNIVKIGLSEQEFKMFEQLSTHRNKMVHFFHEAHTADGKLTLQHDVVRSQLKAWYVLHRLLTEKWKDEFTPWLSQIAEIDKKLKEVHEFLAVIFENKKQNISTLKNEGYIFRICPSCNFEAQKHISEKKEMYQSECLVCELHEDSIQVECPDCEDTVFFSNYGEATCENCGKSLKPEDLADLIIDGGGAYIAAKEGDDQEYIANCTECNGYHTVVLTENGEHICSNCLTKFESIQYCQWCHEGNTGDMEASYWSGCSECDGKMGWERDD